MNIATQSERPAASANIPSTIEKTITLRAPRSRVWRALTEVHEFCAWFSLEDTNDAIAQGARLHMTPKPEMGCDPFYMFVEEIQPEHLFSWRWHPGALDSRAEYYAEPTTLVVFRLEEVAEGTKLTVTESGFNQISLARRAKVFRENTDGWEFQMNALKKYVGQAS